jgi:hypothetical protein
MKKIHILSIALVALFALSAVTASMASAETTLLAEWLNNGKPITTNLASTSSGEILLEDTKLGIGVLCSGTFVGTVGENGEDLITAVLNLSGVEVTLSALVKCEAHKFCESGTDIGAAPDKLPWATLLILMENGTFLDVFFASEYFTECLVLGVKVSESCEAPQTGGELVNVTGGVEGVGAPTPKANCTSGGKEAGIIEFQAGNLTSLTEGGPLTVSSE